ncbi:hypothetical protein [Luteolibacter soli]|uniref:Lipoprotein n=1 Tax=Luteolibacter soli TaxID=3135280 RepID=A0ABU9AVR4_9BACT
MKTTNPPLALLLTIAALTTTAPADEASFRAALTTLPPKYLADIPLTNRATLFKELATDTTPQRLDAPHGWLNFYSDGGDVKATSIIWAKELPRPSGQPPLIFIHMEKPFSGLLKGAPKADQTFVLEPVGKDWIDVTWTVIPDTVDMTMHFRTHRNDTTIEAAPWKEIDRADGRGKTWTYGQRTLDLHWTGKKFAIEKPAGKKLSDH